MWYKVKKIMLGTQQVRPAPLYKYEYDFRNKNATTLANDWWINVLWAASGLTYNSDWIHNSWSPYENVLLKIEWISSVIANAKKITLNMVWKSSFWQVSLSFREVATSSSRTGTTWIYFQRWDYNNPCAVYWWIYWTSAYQTVSASTYYNTWFWQTWVFDFVNKTLTITDTLWFSNVVTLTDTQISNIKTKMTNFWFALWRTTSMQSISILME